MSALELREGVATFGELLAAGVRPTSLARAVEAGTVLRPVRGVYVLPGGFAPFAAAKRLGGHVSHLSAARFHGLEMLRPPSSHHVTVPRARRKERLAGATIYRRDLSALDRDGRWPVTSLLRTCLDCLRTAPLREAVVIGDSALRTGEVTREELRAAAARLRGNGSRSARTAAALLDPRCESVLESVARVEMHLGGLPEPETQVVVGTPLGRRRLDFLFRPQGVGVETDGFGTHGTRAGLLADCARHNGYALLPGLVVLRFGFEHVMAGADEFVRTVRLALDLVGSAEVPQCRSCARLVLGGGA